VPYDDEARQLVEGILGVEDALIDSGMLPSDFQLLVGRRRRVQVGDAGPSVG
jgi:hypothetical protein